MTSRGFAIRPEVTLSEGRMFDAGKHEVVVGRLLREEFPSLAVDNQLSINGVAWIIVGVFESRGDAHESEILADGSALMAMTGANEYSSATVRLTEPDTFSAFSSAVSAIPGTNLKAQRESDYYEGQSETISSVAFVLAYVVSTIMALGAVSGALNITYSVVDARAVEIATLHALGFGSLPIIVSILAEALLLGVVGGSTGALLAWVSLDGGTFVTAQYLGVGASVNNMALSLTITPQLIATGIGWACAIGLLGALLPAIRVSRRPIAHGLRVG
jgi:putative ABC transport system permease protein